ncbi:UNVERIFIED_CONTAM: hypothetical protein Sradi_5735300 [Sesamum radiatum]|uniref:Uncharacterized protein n=1 Tax=Sesamum radiatum TaxID=300843 RepID=A0AAW2L531_SESRA
MSSSILCSSVSSINLRPSLKKFSLLGEERRSSIRRGSVAGGGENPAGQGDQPRSGGGRGETPRPVDPSSTFEFLLSRTGDRIKTPPPGYFTVYSSFFSSGFTLPPHPLLLDITRESGLCVSQFTPNSFLYFEGFLLHFRELSLPLSAESFFTLFSVRKIANDSFFFFFPQNRCKFLAGSASSKGPWKEKFLYVKDVDWGLVTDWGEVSPALSSSHDLHMSFIGAGLFDQLLGVKSLLASGKKVSLQDIQRYKAEREREQRDRDGRGRPPPMLRKDGERRRSPPPPSRPRDASHGQGGSGKEIHATSSGSKRPHEGEAVEAPHGIGKGLFSYGVNRHEGGEIILGRFQL